MKKILLIAAVAITASAAMAAREPGLFSNDRAAVEAVIKSGKLLNWKRLGYLVRLADIDDPEAAKTFDGYMALIEQVGQDNGYSQAQINDAKMFLPFLRRSFGNEAYMLARKMGHPYELRYMIAPKLAQKAVNRVYPTPAARSKAALALLNRHFKTYGAWGSPKDMCNAVTYIYNNGKAGKVTTMSKDLQALNKRIKTTKHAAAHSFKGVPELIDKYTGTKTAASRAKASSYLNQWRFIREEVKKVSRTNPQVMRNYALFTEFCEKTAREHDLQARVLADAKCAIPYFYSGPMLKDAMIYTMEIEHPYEIRYLTNAKNAKNVASVLTTPKKRYDRMIYVLKKHTARYSEWNAPDIITGAVKYLKECADSDAEITTFIEDCNQLKLIFAPYAAQRPQTWKPVIAQLDEYTI